MANKAKNKAAEKRRKTMAKRRIRAVNMFIFQKTGIGINENAYDELCRFISEGETHFQEIKDKIDEAGMSHKEKNRAIRKLITDDYSDIAI